jgi:hypothetical protein
MDGRHSRRPGHPFRLNPNPGPVYPACDIGCCDVRWPVLHLRVDRAVIRLVQGRCSENVSPTMDLGVKTDQSLRMKGSLTRVDHPNALCRATRDAKTTTTTTMKPIAPYMYRIASDLSRLHEGHSSGPALGTSREWVRRGRADQRPSWVKATAHTAMPALRSSSAISPSAPW